MTKRHIKATDLISDFIDDTGIVQTEVPEGLLDKWILDAYEKMEVPEDLMDHVAILPIVNFKVDLPDNFKYLCEIAYKKEKPKEDCKVKGHRIVSWVQNTMDGCELEMNLHCPACHKTSCNCNTEGIIVDVDRVWEMAHPEVYYSNYVKVGRFGYGVSAHSDEYQLMCPTKNPFFEAHHLPECANLKCQACPAEYRINYPHIETSEKDGEVLLSYIGRRIDEDGDILINIEDSDVVDAIKYHLQYSWFYREFQMKREASSRVLYQEAYQLREDYIARVMSRSMIPTSDNLMRYWAENKFSKIAEAYGNLIDGKLPIPGFKNKNVYT